MQSVSTNFPDENQPSQHRIGDDVQGVTKAPAVPVSKLRKTLMCEIDSMARFHISNGITIDGETLDMLAAVDAGDNADLAVLIRTHQSLAALSNIRPHTISMILDAEKGGAISGILGPTPAVRRLTLATLFFALTFFATSLSSTVNVETMQSSIYELGGMTLAIKLLLITSAAGLGAGFAVLFDLWRDLKQYHFDPMSESANWMQLGLGVFAGLILSEIVASEPVLSGAGDGNADNPMLMSGPLLALVGGFSATVLHLVLKNLVDAFKRVLDPGNSESSPDLLRRKTTVVADAKNGISISGAPQIPRSPDK